MGTRRQPSEQFLRRLRSSGEPVVTMPPVVTAPLEPPSQAQTKSARYKHWGHYAFRFFEVLALLFLFPTAYVLIVDLEDRQTQRIAQAWQLVTQNAPGNSGKIHALEYLNSEDCVLPDDPTKWELFMSCGFLAYFVPPKLEQSLTGINLSDDSLSAGVYLVGVELPGADLATADLSGARLEKANLSGAYLARADLSGARLWSANLPGARLERADLSGASLERADLSGASLWNANLSGASLERADLSGANLEKADLSGASLERADLSGANLEKANLSGANFTAVTLFSAAPYEYPLSRKMLMGRSYNAFPWPMDAPSGGFYWKGLPPYIDPSLLVHFTAVGDRCTWIEGLRHAECVSFFRLP